MAKYGAMAKEEVRKAVKKTEHGTQKSGKKGKAKSRKQAIAIGLSKAQKGGQGAGQKGLGKEVSPALRQQTRRQWGHSGEPVAVQQFTLISAVPGLLESA